MTTAVSDTSIQHSCLSQLIKFKEVHHLSQMAISDIVEFAKLLHVHYVSQAQAEIESAYEVHAPHLPTMQELVDCVSISHPLVGLETDYRLQAHVAKDLPYVVSLLEIAYHFIMYDDLYVHSCLYLICIIIIIETQVD